MNARESGRNVRRGHPIEMTKGSAPATVRRSAAGLAGLFLTAIVLTSCSGADGGGASPESTNTAESSGSSSQGNTAESPSTPSATAPSQNPAPEVDNPLDVSSIKADPCSALSPQQVEQLGLKPGKVNTGVNCAYDYAEVVGNRVNITHVRPFTNGLADVYLRKEALAYFEPTQVSGYPAVYAGKYDFRDRGRCSLQVGLNNNDVITIFAQLNGGTDRKRPCEVVNMTAQAMITNLQSES